MDDLKSRVDAIEQQLSGLNDLNLANVAAMLDIAIDRTDKLDARLWRLEHELTLGARRLAEPDASILELMEGRVSDLERKVAGFQDNVNTWLADYSTAKEPSKK